MPRKKSASGRARGKSPERDLLLKIDKANRRLRSLEKAGNFNTNATQELVRFVQSNPYLSIKTSKKKRVKVKGRKSTRRAKRHIIQLAKGKIPTGQQRLINKKLVKVLSSKTFSNIGIKKSREKLKQTLEEETGRELTDKDVDMFDEVIKYQQVDIVEQIGASEFYQLVQIAGKNSYSVTQWIDLLNNYVEINNEYMRNQAEYLYNKFVR